MQSHNKESAEPAGSEASEKTVTLADIARKMEEYRWESMSLGAGGLALATIVVGIALVLAHTTGSGALFVFAVAVFFVIIAVIANRRSTRL